MPRGVYERTSEHRAAISDACKGIPKPPRTPEHCAAISKAKKGVPHLPEHNDAISNACKGIPKSPKARAAMSSARSNSDAVRVANENQRGGNDIVEHHYIYDHSDLSKYTMKVTRSRHSQLHGWMRRSGIKVPHINGE